MPVIETVKDLDRHMLTVVTEYAAPPAHVWQLWSDPRKLEKWWGPPGYPATVTHHDLRPGGEMRYHMTSPEGQRYPGGWRVLEVEPEAHMRVEDFFLDADGNEDTSLPTGTMVLAITRVDDDTTRMVIEAIYPDAESLQKVLEMGMEEGIRAAAGQIDDLLAEIAG